MSASVEVAAGHRPIRSWLPWVLWAALTVALVAAARALPWSDVLARLGTARPGWIAAAVLANVAILPLWALEWRLLAPRAFAVSWSRMFEIVSVTASVLNAVPMLAGEASAVGLLIVRAGLSRGAALSVLALDQLLVAFAKLATITAAAIVATLPGWLVGGVISLATAFAALLVALVVLAHARPEAHAAVTDAGPLRRGLHRLVAWGRQMDALREPRVMLVVAALALLKKLAELLAILAVQVALGVEPALPAALLVLAALAVTTLVPIAPGNLGVYEATVFACYRFVGIPADAALGLAMVQHACFLLPSLATGHVVATVTRLRGRP